MSRFYVNDWIHLSGYCPGFFKILKITDDEVELTQIGSVPLKGEKLSECKLMPFNQKQLQKLVGKVVYNGDDAFLVLSAANGAVIIARQFCGESKLVSLSAVMLMESYFIDERGLPLCNIEKA